MPLFGPVHLALLAAIGAAAAAAAWLCRRRRISTRAFRLAMGWGLAINEVIWWVFRYSHEGVHWSNLPLQLCDATVWSAVIACLTLIPAVVEFAYFAGLAGAGMAVLTPDLWSPWPSYPATYFFAAHGGACVLARNVVVLADPRADADEVASSVRSAGPERIADARLVPFYAYSLHDGVQQPALLLPAFHLALGRRVHFGNGCRRGRRCGQDFRPAGSSLAPQQRCAGHCCSAPQKFPALHQFFCRIRFV
jgi:hypothetical protein